MTPLHDLAVVFLQVTTVHALVTTQNDHNGQAQKYTSTYWRNLPLQHHITY